MNSNLLSTQQYINLSIPEVRIKDLQKILLYLKFVSNTIDYEKFSLVYQIEYRNYIHIINTLLKEKVIAKINKKSKYKTFRLILKPQIFKNATEQEEYQVYQYLQTHSDKELKDKVNIILNHESLELLHELQNSELPRFQFSKKTKPLNHLINSNAVKKLTSKTYTLTENYNQELYKLEQQKLLKNSQLISNDNYLNLNLLNYILENVKWFDTPNIHNLNLTIKINGLYSDISLDPFYKPIESNNKQIPILEDYKIEHNTFVNVFLHQNDTLVITVKCSENPILVNDTLRLNMILSEVLDHINNISTIAKQLDIKDYYNYDYSDFTITKHDFALDGLIPCLLPKGKRFKYTNQFGKELILYVKETYESSNSSWVRVEDRANKTTYILQDFRTKIQTRKLNLLPHQQNE